MSTGDRARDGEGSQRSRRADHRRSRSSADRRDRSSRSRAAQRVPHRRWLWKILDFGIAMLGGRSGIYRSLTGHLPFASRDTPSRLDAVVHDMPLRPSSLATVPADLESLLAIASREIARQSLSNGSGARRRSCRCGTRRALGDVATTTGRAASRRGDERFDLAIRRSSRPTTSSRRLASTMRAQR